jgi:adenosylmethionine-8-amino-7-oxononanoate aminotransferase
VDGDVVLVGPPLVISDDEVDLLVERLAGAVGAAITSVVGG